MVSDILKTSPKETYTFTFNQNLTTNESIGNDSSLSSLMYDLFDKDKVNVGYINFAAGFRAVQNTAPTPTPTPTKSYTVARGDDFGFSSSSSTTGPTYTDFNNASTSIFLKDKDNKFTNLIALSNLVLTGNSNLAANNSFTITSTFTSGPRFEGKIVYAKVDVDGNDRILNLYY